jgi:hypothetical protein
MCTMQVIQELPITANYLLMDMIEQATLIRTSPREVLNL